jgi:hypothetical protein
MDLGLGFATTTTKVAARSEPKRVWVDMVLSDEKIEEVATLMEELARALRSLKVDAGESTPQRPPDPVPADEPQQQGANAFPIGARIVVTRVLDRHRGRTGTIVNRRGELFWNIKLDIRGNEASGPLIYKKWTSIQRIP